MTFTEWLGNIDRRPLRQIRDNTARINRVESCLCVNLETEYSNDECESILEKLVTSNADFLKTVDLPTDMAGLSSLKTSVRKFVKYCKYCKT